jgi:hypothetical protein
VVLMALLAVSCSPPDADADGEAHNTSASGSKMQMHVFTCEDGSSVLTGLSTDSFVVDLVGSSPKDRETLTAPRARARAVDGRLTVAIGKDLLHLERIGQKGGSEHLSFRGKSCWR